MGDRQHLLGNDLSATCEKKMGCSQIWKQNDLGMGCKLDISLAVSNVFKSVSDFQIFMFGHGKQLQVVEYSSKFETQTPDLILISGTPKFLDSSQILSQKESPIQNITILPVKSKKTKHVLSPRNAQHLYLNAIELIKACPGASLRRNLWETNWEIYYHVYLYSYYHI